MINKLGTREMGWGYELIWASSDKYCGKIMVFTKKGAQPTDADFLLRNEKVNKRIVEAFEKEGADAWYEDNAKKRFLEGLENPDDYNQVFDILDVWFDSGSTHAFVLRDRDEVSEDCVSDLYV